MRVMVCDSENNDICRLRDLISEYGADHNMSFDIEYYGNGEALMAALEDEGCPDIIIVEISSETGGIDAVKQIRSASGSVPLIIISSEIRYALEGYKVKAKSFILRDDLDAMLPECIEDICKENVGKIKTKVFKCTDGNRRIKLSDIVMLETAGRLVLINTISQTFQTHEKMDVLEKDMAGSGFIRIHRCYLVNARYIDSICNYSLYLKDGTELSVPRGRFRTAKKEYQLFKGRNR